MLAHTGKRGTGDARRRRGGRRGRRRPPRTAGCGRRRPPGGAGRRSRARPGGPRPRRPRRSGPRSRSGRGRCRWPRPRRATASSASRTSSTGPPHGGHGAGVVVGRGVEDGLAPGPAERQQVAGVEGAGRRQRHQLAVAVPAGAAGAHAERPSSAVIARPASPRAGWATRVSVSAARWAWPASSPNAAGGNMRSPSSSPPSASSGAGRGKATNRSPSMPGAGCPGPGNRNATCGRLALGSPAASARRPGTRRGRPRPPAAGASLAGEVVEVVGHDRHLHRARARRSRDGARPGRGGATAARRGVVGGQQRRPGGRARRRSSAASVGARKRNSSAGHCVERRGPGRRRRRRRDSTAWKFVPPKPKALTPGRAGAAPTQGRASSRNTNGLVVGVAGRVGLGDVAASAAARRGRRPGPP